MTNFRLFGEKSKVDGSKNRKESKKKVSMSDLKEKLLNYGFSQAEASYWAQELIDKKIDLLEKKLSLYQSIKKYLLNKLRLFKRQKF